MTIAFADRPGSALLSRLCQSCNILWCDTNISFWVSTAHLFGCTKGIVSFPKLELRGGMKQCHSWTTVQGWEDGALSRQRSLEAWTVLIVPVSDPEVGTVSVHTVRRDWTKEHQTPTIHRRTEPPMATCSIQSASSHSERSVACNASLTHKIQASFKSFSKPLACCNQASSSWV